MVVCKEQTGVFDLIVYGIECLLSGTSVKSLNILYIIRVFLNLLHFLVVQRLPDRSCPL